MRRWRAKRRTKMIRAFIAQIATEDLTVPQMNSLVREASRRVGGGRRLASLVYEDFQDAHKVARKGRGYRRVLRHFTALAKIAAAVPPTEPAACPLRRPDSWPIRQASCQKPA
jgi:hypothetical protein